MQHGFAGALVPLDQNTAKWNNLSKVCLVHTTACLVNTPTDQSSP